MTIYVWGAIAVVILTLAALIRRYDTKLVLLIAGLAMCCLSMNPMAAFQQFDKSMTNSALIISICSSMGFAACVTMTKCDLHLVSLLTKPLNKLGILLLPCCMIVTGIASVAIGSLAGLCAAIGPTLVGLMIRAGFRPAMAAAVIISSTLPNYWSPGSTDNIYVAKLANIPVMDMVTYVAPTTLILSALSIVFVMIVCLLFKDYRKEGFGSTGVHPGEDIQKKLPDLPEKPNLLMAFAPLLPVVLLFVISLCFPGVKMSVATAMLMGLIYVMIVTRLNPQQLCSKFFDGMGSGNAAAFAFNESVTPHALEFGMKIEDLGFIACVSATLGRVSSPLAAGVILIAGIAGASPLDVVKRSIPVMLCTIGALYFLV